jgi:hypothetical protein
MTVAAAQKAWLTLTASTNPSVAALVEQVSATLNDAVKEVEATTDSVVFPTQSREPALEIRRANALNAIKSSLKLIIARGAEVAAADAAAATQATKEFQEGYTSTGGSEGGKPKPKDKEPAPSKAPLIAGGVAVLGLMGLLIWKKRSKK